MLARTWHNRLILFVGKKPRISQCSAPVEHKFSTIHDQLTKPINFFIVQSWHEHGTFIHRDNGTLIARKGLIQLLLFGLVQKRVS